MEVWNIRGRVSAGNQVKSNGNKVMIATHSVFTAAVSLASSICSITYNVWRPKQIANSTRCANIRDFCMQL